MVPLDPDPFSTDRRYEQRYPDLVAVLPSFLAGYGVHRVDHDDLELLEGHIQVNEAMREASPGHGSAVASLSIDNFLDRIMTRPKP
jgi:hypothetical protein